MSCPATTKQKEVAEKLGLDISGVSERAAAARIRDALAEVILERVHSPTPTSPQIEFARSLGLDVARDSFRVAFAKIRDCLEDENARAIREMDLRPGVEVELAYEMDMGGKMKRFRDKFIISSIHQSGRVYFKKTTGHFAYALSLIHI